MPVATRKAKSEIKIPFLDKHEFGSSALYSCPNENVLAWRQLVQGLEIERAAGICSGGEVGLFALLPVVQKELVLIDHSYHSLSYAMFKYATLRSKGPRAVLNLFGSGSKDRLLGEYKKVKSALPESVAEKFSPFNLNPTGLKRYWDEQKFADAKAVIENLDKVRFVHGDLTDLVDEGPFDLLYLSNALEHTSRTGRAAAVTDVAKAVRPGGYVLDCSYYISGSLSWRKVADRRTNWTQTLWQLPD